MITPFTFSSTRSENIFTRALFSNFEYTLMEIFYPLFFTFWVHTKEINPFFSISRTLYVREHSVKKTPFFAKFGTIMRTHLSMRVTTPGTSYYLTFWPLGKWPLTSLSSSTHIWYYPRIICSKFEQNWCRNKWEQVQQKLTHFTEICFLFSKF